MKKILLLMCCVATFAACNTGKTGDDKVTAERDSLLLLLANKDAEMNEMLGTINEVQQGFSQINEAENRVTVANADEELNASTRDQIRENMAFIQQTLQDNRNKIAQLQERLKVSNLNASKMKQTIEMLTAQLEAQTRQIQELQAQLVEKDSLIGLQSTQINELQENVSGLEDANARQSEKLAAQDKDLNAAWFVFGTKAELKEQKILQKGDVLKNGDFNTDYFTKIDIRIDKEMKLYSKHATILTTHPAKTYELVKDNQGLYTLKITNPKKFWSTSRYLVIQVR